MNRYPVNGTFELTLRCNLHCQMCMFRHADCENTSLQSQELTAEQWIDMAKQVAQAGTLSLLITGGEPMLRKDFCEIYSSIYRLGFLVTLYTNATLVTDEIMETLRSIRLTGLALPSMARPTKPMHLCAAAGTGLTVPWQVPVHWQRCHQRWNSAPHWCRIIMTRWMRWKPWSGRSSTCR